MTEGIRSSWKIAVPATKIMLMPKSRFRKKSACLIWLDFFAEFKFSGTSEAAESVLVSRYLELIFELSSVAVSNLISGWRRWIVFLLRISLNFFDQTKNTPVTCYDPGNTKHQQKPGFCIQPLIHPTADQKTHNNRQSQFQTHRTVHDPFWARFV